MSNYRKTMTEALREMYPLNEGTIDKVKEIASKKQAMKIDGVMVDSFTASAISQIYDKVNDATKKKMEKLPITKLANLAMKMMQKNEFVPEEAELDEGKMQDMWQKKNAQSLSVGPFELLRGKSGVHTIKRSGKVLGDFSYDSDADNFVANMKGMKGQWTGNDIDSLFTHLQKVHKEEVELDEVSPNKQKSDVIVMKKGNVEKSVVGASGVKKAEKEGYKIQYALLAPNGKKVTSPKDIMKAIKSADKLGIGEEVDLDEATKQVLAHGGKGKYKVTKDGDKIDIKFGGKVVGTADFDRGADSFFVSIKGEKGQKSFDDAQAIADYFAKNKITEEADLDEGFSPKEIKMAIGIASDKRYAGGNMTGAVAAIDKIKKGLSDHPQVAAVLRRQNEEDELDEGSVTVDLENDDPKLLKDIKRMGLKVKDNGDSGNAGYNEYTITGPDSKLKAGGKKFGWDQQTEKVEEGAAADARRAMRRDKDFSRRDSADDDTDATDDDIKGASKNIMMQMRKAQSLASGGKFKVEFGDGKKVKIPANMAIAVQQKYNAMRKPADKEKFQARIGKSYKDMLSALKEELQPKKESILERMNRKIKENKDG